MKKSRTKKVSALILLALCFSLAASSLFSCGDTVDENNTSDQASESVDTTAPEDTTEKKIHVFVFLFLVVLSYSM